MLITLFTIFSKWWDVTCVEYWWSWVVTFYVSLHLYFFRIAVTGTRPPFFSVNLGTVFGVQLIFSCVAANWLHRHFFIYLSSVILWLVRLTSIPRRANACVNRFCKASARMAYAIIYPSLPRKCIKGSESACIFCQNYLHAWQYFRGFPLYNFEYSKLTTLLWIGRNIFFMWKIVI